MTRRKLNRTKHIAGRPLPSSGSSQPPSAPADVRVGLVFFALLELGTYVTLARATDATPAQPPPGFWRGGFLAATVTIIAGLVVLWWAGRRGRRLGWIVILAVFWLVVLTGRLIPLFVIGGSSVPVLLTIYVGQLMFGLLVPVALHERRKTAATGA